MAVTNICLFAPKATQYHSYIFFQLETATSTLTDAMLLIRTITL